MYAALKSILEKFENSERFWIFNIQHRQRSKSGCVSEWPPLVMLNFQNPIKAKTRRKLYFFYPMENQPTGKIRKFNEFIIRRIECSFFTENSNFVTEIGMIFTKCIKYLSICPARLPFFHLQ